MPAVDPTAAAIKMVKEICMAENGDLIFRLAVTVKDHREQAFSPRYPIFPCLERPVPPAAGVDIRYD